MAIDLVVNDDAIDLKFTGWDRLWALSSGIHLPISEVTDARVAEVGPMKKDSGLRTGGGYWPGKMATGHFTGATARDPPAVGRLHGQRGVGHRHHAEQAALDRPAASLQARPRVAHRRAHPRARSRHGTSHDDDDGLLGVVIARRQPSGQSRRRGVRRRGSWRGRPAASCR